MGRLAILMAAILASTAASAAPTMSVAPAASVRPSAPAASARPAAQDVRLTGSHPCSDQAGFTCSTLRVPLDHHGANGRTLDLAVAVEDKPAATHFLLLLTGGPGQPGVPFATRLSSKVTATLPDYRMVLIDERGTGANALQCPELQKQMGSTDLAVPTPQAVTDCAAAIGPDRRFYGTADTVADLDELRAALGADTITVDGVSYGTYVAERYAITYPEQGGEGRPGLRPAR
ncbi:MAG TPA: alpha/beta hydrolase [Jatrophihabitantaceae bacterium]|jgi:pimeloyl-ACP methyl ester carboxylesterase